MPKKKSGGKVVELSLLGAGLAGLAATAYFFLGPKGKKHQKDVKSWAIKMKGDVVEKLEQAKEISEPVYHEIINSVADDYEKGMRAGKEEIMALSEDLKKHWATISKTAMKAKSKLAKDAKDIASKAKM